MDNEFDLTTDQQLRLWILHEGYSLEYAPKAYRFIKDGILDPSENQGVVNMRLTIGEPMIMIPREWIPCNHDINDIHIVLGKLEDDACKFIKKRFAELFAESKNKTASPFSLSLNEDLHHAEEALRYEEDDNKPAGKGLSGIEEMDFISSKKSE